MGTGWCQALSLLPRRPAPQGHDAEAYTSFALDRLSAMIVSLPGQYFWHRKRFKYACPPPLKAGRRAWRDANICGAD